MTRTNRKYQIPGSTELALKDGLSSKLKELWAGVQDRSFDLFLLAAGLRNRYLDKAGEQYSPDFQEWYQKHEINSILGKMPSFTKYAMAGNVVHFFANEFKDGKYINQLPLSRNALYEISLLKALITSSELEKLFYQGGADGDALISPSATAADISSYRNRLQGKPKAKAVKTTKFNIPLATIYVSRDLYKFQKGTGQHIGDVGIEDAKKLIATLTGRIDNRIFDLRDNLEKIETAYTKKLNAASPSAKLKKTSAKATKSKRAAKKASKK